MIVANKINKRDLSLKIAERDHLNACIELLAMLGIVAYRQNTGMARYANKDGSERIVKYGLRGIPDICGYIPKKITGKNYAVPFYWEVKRKVGKLTEYQREFIESAKDNGCFIGWGTVEDLKISLKEWGVLNED